MKRILKYVMMIATAIMVASCAPREPHQAAYAPTSPISTNAPILTTTQVLATADSAAVKRGYDLQHYPSVDAYRKAIYDPENGTWRVYYARQPNRHPGDHFSISIDDKTSNAQYFGGK